MPTPSNRLPDRGQATIGRPHILEQQRALCPAEGSQKAAATSGAPFIPAAIQATQTLVPPVKQPYELSGSHDSQQWTEDSAPTRLQAGSFQPCLGLRVEQQPAVTGSSKPSMPVGTQILGTPMQCAFVPGQSGPLADKAGGGRSRQSVWSSHTVGNPKLPPNPQPAAVDVSHQVAYGPGHVVVVVAPQSTSQAVVGNGQHHEMQWRASPGQYPGGAGGKDPEPEGLDLGGSQYRWMDVEYQGRSGGEDASQQMQGFPTQLATAPPQQHTTPNYGSKEVVRNMGQLTGRLPHATGPGMFARLEAPPTVPPAAPTVDGPLAAVSSASHPRSDFQAQHTSRPLPGAMLPYGAATDQFGRPGGYRSTQDAPSAPSRRTAMAWETPFGWTSATQELRDTTSRGAANDISQSNAAARVLSPEGATSLDIPATTIQPRPWTTPYGSRELSPESFFGLGQDTLAGSDPIPTTNCAADCCQGKKCTASRERETDFGNPRNAGYLEDGRSNPAVIWDIEAAYGQICQPEAGTFQAERVGCPEADGYGEDARLAAKARLEALVARLNAQHQTQKHDHQRWQRFSRAALHGCLPPVPIVLASVASTLRRQTTGLGILQSAVHALCDELDWEGRDCERDLRDRVLNSLSSMAVCLDLLTGAVDRVAHTHGA